MQPADRLGPQPHELITTVRQQPQRLGPLVDPDLQQVAGPQRGQRNGVGIDLVALATGLVAENARTSEDFLLGTSNTVSPLTTNRCARFFPTPVAPSIAHSRRGHRRANPIRSANPVVDCANVPRANTDPVASTATTALIRLCGSTAIFTTDFSTTTTSQDSTDESRGGHRYFGPCSPLSSHSPKAVPGGIAGH